MLVASDPELDFCMELSTVRSILKELWETVKEPVMSEISVLVKDIEPETIVGCRLNIELE
jgi:hypothetical protein